MQIIEVETSLDDFIKVKTKQFELNCDTLSRGEASECVCTHEMKYCIFGLDKAYRDKRDDKNQSFVEEKNVKNAKEDKHK